MIFVKIAPVKNMKRFYILNPVEQTLFENLYAVRIEYGRIGGMRRFITKLFEDKTAAQKYHDRSYANRIRHEYRII